MVKAESSPSDMYYVNIKINIPQNFILNAIWLVCSGHSFWIKHTCILYNVIQQLFEKSLGPIFTKHPSFASDEILRKVLESWCFQEVKTKSLWRIVNCREQEGDFLRWWKSAQVYGERAEKQKWSVWGSVSLKSCSITLDWCLHDIQWISYIVSFGKWAKLSGPG